MRILTKKDAERYGIKRKAAIQKTPAIFGPDLGEALQVTVSNMVTQAVEKTARSLAETVADMVKSSMESSASKFKEGTDDLAVSVAAMVKDSMMKSADEFKAAMPKDRQHIESMVNAITDLVTQSAGLNTNAAVLVEMIKGHIENQPTPQVVIPEPVKRWKFTVARNPDGLISEVTADRLE